MKKRNFNHTMQSSPPPQLSHLEPRVAKLEAGLDILTKNVTDLTVAVRDNSNNLENKLERLTIAVTEAQAPKKTDWSTIFAGAMFFLAIGSAVFWPLNQTTIDTKNKLEQSLELLADHQKQDQHPVGEAVVSRLEANFEKHQDESKKLLLETIERQKADFEFKIEELKTENRYQRERELAELQLWRKKLIESTAKD